MGKKGRRRGNYPNRDSAERPAENSGACKDHPGKVTDARSARHNRARRAAVARETLNICKSGGYYYFHDRGSGEGDVHDATCSHVDGCSYVSIHGEGDGNGPGGSTNSSIYIGSGTPIVPPNPNGSIVAPSSKGEEPRGKGGACPTIQVTGEGTIEAAARLVQGEGAKRVACLNFASAKNPGGGFLNGSLAQEESLALCSELYVSLHEHEAKFYQPNRDDARDGLYSDDLILSRDVAVFRDDRDLTLLEHPFQVAMITSPAPNSGVARRKGVSPAAVSDCLNRRAARVVEAAAAFGYTTLVLGAWGCGVFKNDPREVAVAFRRALASHPHSFDTVVFAVRGRNDGNMKAFEECFRSS